MIFLLLSLFAFFSPIQAVESPAPLIVLDPGHGGSADGAKIFPVMEKRIALFTAVRTKKALEELGYRVFLTRSRDRFVDLDERVAMANRVDAALFVSIHFNSAPNPAAHGIEVYYFNEKTSQRTKASKQLAIEVLKATTRNTSAFPRGARPGNFYVVRETKKMPAILFEGGFLTNEPERNKLADKKYLKSLAQGIAEGIHSYFENAPKY